MDLLQKFIEASLFDFDEYFLESLQNLSIEDAQQIFYDLSAVAEYLPNSSDEYQSVYGVTSRTEVFFMVVFVKEEGQIPIFLDVIEVTLDEYLDSILENKTIKSYYDGEHSDIKTI